MAKAGGGGRLRGEWGCMFKSRVLIRWNGQFNLKQEKEMLLEGVLENTCVPKGH